MVQINWQKKYAELKSEYDTLEEKFRQLEKKLINIQKHDIKFKQPLFSSGELGVIQILFFDKSKDFVHPDRLIAGYNSTKVIKGIDNEADTNNILKVLLSRIRKKLAIIDCYIISSTTYPTKYVLDDYDKLLLCKVNNIDPIATLGLDPEIVKDRKYPIMFRRFGSKYVAEYNYPYAKEEFERRDAENKKQAERKRRKKLNNG